MVYRHSWTIQKNQLSVVIVMLWVCKHMQTILKHSHSSMTLFVQSPHSLQTPREKHVKHPGLSLKRSSFQKARFTQEFFEAQLMVAQPPDFACANHWNFPVDLPSGKHTKKYGKSPFLMGKLTIIGPFSIAMLVITRG